MSDFELDLSTRRVIPPDDMGAVGVASDERVRPLRFTMPRFYEGFDLAEFQFRVNYENAGGDDDIYLVDDMEAGDDSITLTWLLSRLATAYEGTVTYVICGLKFADDGITVEQEINSTVASFEVLKGFEVGDAAEFAVRLDWLNAVVAPMVEAEAERVTNEGLREIAEADRIEAEADRAEAEGERATAEASRQATFADMVATFADAKILVLGDGQYDEEGVPTIEGAPGVVYFVPVESTEDDDDHYVEWVCIDGAFERMGTTQANFKAASPEAIDAIIEGEEVDEGNEVVTQSGLKYLWTKIKAWIVQKLTPIEERVDTLEDNWDSLSQISKVASVKVGNMAWFNRYSNGMVQMEFGSSTAYPLAPGGTHTIGTIPEGYRPIDTITLTFPTGSLYARLFLYHDGRLLAYSYNNSQDINAYTSLTYVTEDDYPGGDIVIDVSGAEPELKG